MSMSPALQAELDQLLAAQNEQIDNTLALLRGQAAQDGQGQALANMARALEVLPQDVKDLALLTLLARLAFREEMT